MKNAKDKDSKLTMALYGNYITFGKNIRICVDKSGDVFIISDTKEFVNDLRKNYSEEDKRKIVEELGLEDLNV